MRGSVCLHRGAERESKQRKVNPGTGYMGSHCGAFVDFAVDMNVFKITKLDREKHLISASRNVFTIYFPGCVRTPSCILS